MKPSTKIREIFNKWHPNNPNKTEIGIVDDWVSSIITYLDEQYEQQKPCEHEYEPFKDYAQTCKKCVIITN